MDYTIMPRMCTTLANAVFWRLPGVVVVYLTLANVVI